MNIIKSKRFIVTILTFVMFMALTFQPLPAARERRGATVEVTMADGRLVWGELLAVKTDALLIYDQDADQGKSLGLRQVIEVKVLKKSKIFLGLAIGLGVGIVVNVLAPPTHGHPGIGRYIVIPPLFGLFGAMIGNGASMPKKISFTETLPQVVRQKIKQLERYARAQDGLGMTEAESGNRPLSPGNTVPLPPDHSLSARIMTRNEEAAADEREVGRVGKMILAGIAGNLIGTGAGIGLGMGSNILFPAGHEVFIPPGVLLGVPAGSLFGSALGVCLAGNSRNARGNFGSAVLGSFLGELAAVAVAAFVGLGEREGGAVAVLSFAILPPVGAAIAFNSSLRPRSIPTSNALFNVKGGRFGLGVPDVQVRPLYVPGCGAKFELQFNVRVLSMEL